MAGTPEPLPSLPPSPGPDSEPRPPRPIAEEDVARVWHDEPSSSGARKHLSPSRKGKERAVSGGDDTDSDEDDEEASAAAAGYPPTKEEEAETRRVQENLRRWEVAERQRRKAARESASLAPSPSVLNAANSAPSLFADIFRRDSRKGPLGGVGTHHALSSTDDVVALDDLDTPAIDRPPSASPSPSPTPEEHDENPFETPSASRTSLNIPAHSAIMTESETVPEDISGGASKKKNAETPQRPTLQASSSFAPTPERKKSKKKKNPPPPQPLGLPAPREPPRAEGPNVDKPPEPITPLSAESRDQSVEREGVREGAGERARQRQEVEVEVESVPVKWWHEWLCGCGEGPDRGGDNQAGRTNPFE